jgi:putative transposase
VEQKTGLRDIFVLVFLNVKTRQVYITPSAYKPDQAWMIEQAEVFIKHTQEQKLPCKIVMHDNDGENSKPFLDVFKKVKIKPHRTAIRSPNTVAIVERFVQTISRRFWTIL